MRIGIDIGGTKSESVALDDEWNIVARERRPSGHGPDAVLATVLDTVATLSHSNAGASIDSIGIGIPGVVDHETGTVNHAVNLGLDAINLGPLIAERLGVPVVLENDVNAAAIGSFRSLALSGTTVNSLAFLNLGTGIAAGIVIDGKVLRGARGAAGEIGHIPVRDYGPVCRCGQVGCLESFASGFALEQRATSDTRSPLRVADLLLARSASDRSATDVLSDLEVGVASAIRLLAVAFDVELIVVGGGLSKLGAELWPAVQHRIEHWVDASPFLATLEIPDRVLWGPPVAEVAAVGAAHAGVGA